MAVRKCANIVNFEKLRQNEYVFNSTNRLRCSHERAQATDKVAVGVGLMKRTDVDRLELSPAPCIEKNWLKKALGLFSASLTYSVRKDLS